MNSKRIDARIPSCLTLATGLLILVILAVPQTVAAGPFDGDAVSVSDTIRTLPATGADATVKAPAPPTAIPAPDFTKAKDKAVGFFQKLWNKVWNKLVAWWKKLLGVQDDPVVLPPVTPPVTPPETQTGSTVASPTPDVPAVQPPSQTPPQATPPADQTTTTVSTTAGQPPAGTASTSVQVSPPPAAQGPILGIPLAPGKLTISWFFMKREGEILKSSDTEFEAKLDKTFLHLTRDPSGPNRVKALIKDLDGKKKDEILLGTVVTQGSETTVRFDDGKFITIKKLDAKKFTLGGSLLPATVTASYS